ncbi:MAG TPA: ATP-binding protein [Trueperaceae bacterium]|nr:ATP-binding protein [Trueperaceae bacterium]
MTDYADSVRSAAVAQRRSSLNGFLWTLLGVLVVAVVVVAVVESPANVIAQSAGNIILALGIAVALWLNHVHRTRAALTLVIVMVLIGTSLPILAGGLVANERQLTLFFLPLVLAGLTGNRRALYLTVGTTFGVVIIAALGTAASGAADETTRQWSVLYQFLAIYSLVTFTIDRFGQTLQSALRDGEGRESDLRAARAELVSLNEDLERRVAERTGRLEEANSELEAFSYSVSHDLRSPLRSINGFAQILLEEEAANLSEGGRENLDVIRDSAREMGQLIDDLLTFSRLGRQPLNSQELDMGELVRTALADLRADIGSRRIEFIVGDLPPAEGDPQLVRQLLVNLLANAIKFTSKSEFARVEVGATVERDRVSYFVKDNGAGFDMRYVDKIFGVFQRLHSVDEFAGTGVGLALVQRVASRHGGDVTAHGELGVGATFTFSLGSGSEV